MMVTVLLMVAMSGHTYMSTENFTPIERECYKNAMIGYDSVINSRVGVPAEHAIDLTQSTIERNVIWNAYLWKASPHEYAIKTFSSCIQIHQK